MKKKGDPMLLPTITAATEWEGNNKANRKVGTAAADYFKAGGGADTLFGRGGDDVLGGDRGFDRLYGGAGEDVLFLSGGDVAWGGAGADEFLIFDPGNGGGNSRISAPSPSGTLMQKGPITIRSIWGYSPPTAVCAIKTATGG